MPYLKWYAGPIEHLCFVSLDSNFLSFKPGDVFQVLAGTYDKSSNTIQAMHIKTSEKTTLNLDNVTPTQKIGS